MSGNNNVVIDEERLQGFADAFLTTYRNLSLLRQISRVVDYRGQEREFYQLGQRTYLPKEFFYQSDTYDNRVLAGEFAWSLVSSELKFVIDQLIIDRNVSQATISDFSYEQLVARVLENVASPTCILIPIEHRYYSEVSNWIFRPNPIGHLDTSGTQFIRMGNADVRIIWSSKRVPFDKIFAIDMNGIRIVQKRFEDIGVPRGLGRILYTYGEGTYPRLDFAESDKDDQFDFFFRSVIALDAIMPNSAAIIKVNNTHTD